MNPKRTSKGSTTAAKRGPAKANNSRDDNAKKRARNYLLQTLKRLSLNSSTGSRHDQDTQYQFGVLNALRDHPQLASEKFTIENERKYPLGWMIYKRTPNAELVRSIYEAYPPAIQHDFLLHRACETNMKPAIIKFLAKEYPDALGQRDTAGLLPLHHVMRKRPKLEASKIITHLYRLGGEDPLKHALAQDFPLHITSSILGNYPKDIIKFALDDKLTILDLPKAMLLERILPQLRSLDCCPSEWADVHACEHLVACVQNHKRLLDFRLKNISHTMQINTLLAPLRQTIETNRVLKNIEVDVVPYTLEQRLDLLDNRNHSLLRAISAGLTKNDALQMFVLSRLILSDAAVFSEFMNLAPRGLVLSNIVLDEMDDNMHNGVAEVQPVNDENWKSCQIQFLRMRTCAFSRGFYEKLTQGILPQLPCLKRLELDVTLEEKQMTEYELDVTCALLDILQTGNLEYLSVKGEISQVDIEPICDVLRSNSTLKHYDIPVSTKEAEKRLYLVPVLDCNATLGHAIADLKTIYNGPNGGAAEEKIWYFSMLNKYGRSEVRKTDTTKKDFLALIGRINGLPSDKSSLYESAPDDIDRSVLMYGILRECPSLWTSFLASFQGKSPRRSGKRKRIAF